MLNKKESNMKTETINKKTIDIVKYLGDPCISLMHDQEGYFYQNSIMKPKGMCLFLSKDQTILEKLPTDAIAVKATK